MKIFKAFTIFCWICCLVSSVKGQVAHLSLAECLRMAIQNNPTLLQSELLMKQDQIQLNQARANRLPSLNANLSHHLNQGRSIDQSSNQYVEDTYSSGAQSLNLGLPLFDGFRILHDVRMKSNARDAGKLEYESRINTLKLDVIEVYIQVLMASDMIKQFTAQSEVTQEQVRRAEVMSQQGAIAPGDYHDLKGQLKTDLNALETARNALRISRSRLAGLLNVSPTDMGELQAIAPHPESLSTDAHSLYAQAQEALPDIKALEWRIKAAQEGVKFQKSALWPTLSLSAGINSNYSSTHTARYGDQINNNLGKGVSLNLSIPLFNKLEVRNQIALSKLDVQSAQYAKDIRLNSLREETANVVFNLQNAAQNVYNLQGQEMDYKESFRIATVHFENGNSNSIVYLMAKTKLDNARSQLVVKQYEWLLQKYMNDYYAGKLNL